MLTPKNIEFILNIEATTLVVLLDSKGKWVIISPIAKTYRGIQQDLPKRKPIMREDSFVPMVLQCELLYDLEQAGWLVVNKCFDSFAYEYICRRTGPLVDCYKIETI